MKLKYHLNVDENGEKYFMLEIPERLNYSEWDNVDFVLPEKLRLKENSFLHEAIFVFLRCRWI